MPQLYDQDQETDDDDDVGPWTWRDEVIFMLIAAFMALALILAVVA